MHLRRPRGRLREMAHACFDVLNRFTRLLAHLSVHVKYVSLMNLVFGNREDVSAAQKMIKPTIQGQGVVPSKKFSQGPPSSLLS